MTSIPDAGEGKVSEAIERETTRIAKAKGCDRGTFTLCWPEFERGEGCICKLEAVVNLNVKEGAGE